MTSALLFAGCRHGAWLRRWANCRLPPILVVAGGKSPKPLVVHRTLSSGRRGPAFDLRELAVSRLKRAEQEAQLMLELLKRAVESNNGEAIIAAEEKVRQAEDKVSMAEDKIDKTSKDNEDKVDIETSLAHMQDLLSCHPQRSDSLESVCASGGSQYHDFSFRMTLHGRSEFFQRIRDELTWLQTYPPSVMQGTRSVVYSTVSGAGKTRAMLSLQGQLRKLGMDKVQVVYIGFNCGSPLLPDEKEFCISESGAQKVLYRRLIAALLLTLHVQDRARDFPHLANEREVGAVLPVDTKLLQQIPIDGCKLFFARDWLECTLKKRGVKHFIVCVDEVQRLDGFHVQEPGCGLGRFVLRELRDLQRVWTTITVLPLGTGITPDFAEVPTEGTNILLESRQELLVSLTSYLDILTEQLKEIGETTFTEAARGTLARMLWPVVRALEPKYLKEALGELKLRRHPSTQEALAVLDSSLFDKPISKHDFPSDIVPFLAVSSTHVTAVPHAVCAGPLSAVLAESLPTVHSWLVRLPRTTRSIRDLAFSVLKFSDFQVTSFVVLGAYIGLILVRRPHPDMQADAIAMSRRRIIHDLQPFVHSAIVLQDRTPMQVPLTHFYPFGDASRTHLHTHFLDTVSRMQPNSAVAFHAGHGTNAKADYWYVIRGDDAGDKRRFHVLVGDSKHTIHSKGIPADAAKQVLQAKQSLLRLWPKAAPNDVVTTTLFVVSPATTSQSGWPEEVLLLNADTLAFLPWTLFLFRGITVE